MGIRRLTAVVGALLVAAVPLRAQNMWEPEIGIRGGWTHLNVDPSSSYDFADLPGSPNLVDGLGSRAPLFAVIPLTARLALSPELGLADLQAGGGSTAWETGLTADYAFTTHVYAGIGATLSFVRVGGTENAGGGIQAKAGYRLAVTRTLHLRFEGFVNDRPKSHLLPKQTLYGLSFGISTSLK